MHHTDGLIRPEEIIEAFKARVLRECKKDEGEVHLHIDSNNIAMLKQDLIDSFRLDNIPVIEFSCDKIRVGSYILHSNIQLNFL